MRRLEASPIPTKDEINLGHLKKITHKLGIWQHCRCDRPNEEFGFSIDDEARGLIAAAGFWRRGIETAFAERLGGICFSFIERAALSDGHYHNFADRQGRWLDSQGSEDSFGRTLWALAAASDADAAFAPRARALALFARSLTLAGALTYARPKAYVLLALSFLPQTAPVLARQLARDLADTYEATRTDAWRWFDDQMTYCNARLPQAMFVAYSLFPEEDRWLSIGVESLDFLLAAMRLAGKGAGYAPIGNAGWHARGRKRPALFDQQPVDAGALVEACMQAFRVMAEPRFRKAAFEAFAWYHGENIHGLPLYDPQTGGVCDSLTPTGVNSNQGAESILSYLLAYLALDAP